MFFTFSIAALYETHLAPPFLLFLFYKNDFFIKGSLSLPEEGGRKGGEKLTRKISPLVVQKRAKLERRRNKRKERGIFFVLSGAKKLLKKGGKRRARELCV